MFNTLLLLCLLQPVSMMHTSCRSSLLAVTSWSVRKNACFHGISPNLGLLFLPSKQAQHLALCYPTSPSSHSSVSHSASVSHSSSCCRRIPWTLTESAAPPQQQKMKRLVRAIPQTALAKGPGKSVRALGQLSPGGPQP